jgi:GT2 family glycosyltransferase
MKRMAVAIVNWNTRDLLRACLQSAAVEAPAEMVVVDNGSSDGSAEMVEREFPGVMLEVDRANPGYGAASNRALRRCRAEYVLLLNSDTILRPGALAALTDFLDRHPRVGIVGPRLLNPDGTLQRSCFPFPSAFVPVLKRQPFAAMAGLVPWLREAYPAEFSHDEDRRTPWVVGAALGIRRSAFDAVGGFDESFVMYFEEVDLCYRLREAGWETHFSPRAEIVHLGGASTRQRRAEMLVRLSLSSIEFHRRHHRGASLALALAVVRASALGRLARDSARYLVSAPGAGRERLAEDRAVWREVLARSTFAS